ncbi:MAG: M1 family aminopeptidase [Bacteroidota bacterium]
MKVSVNFIMVIMILFSSKVSANLPQQRHSEDCSHFCSHAQVPSVSIGIYDQDERLHDYDVKYYDIDVEVFPGSTYIKGKTIVTAEIIAPGVTVFVLELTQELIVDKVLLDQDTLSFSHQNQVIEIDLEQSYQKGSLLTLELIYEGEPEPEAFFSGLTNATNSFGENVVYTLSEPHNARKWFPVKQVLEDKADSAKISITTPEGFIGASNGLLHQVVELPGNKNRYEWETFYPIAYYLISIAVANYQEYNFYATLSNENDSILVQNFIYNQPGVLEELKDQIDKTKDFMTLFSQIWGDYPFRTEKYGHAQAPLGGAMEHQTLSTMGYFGFDITAHELAHHWFGNQITCATWSDIWINEGFASYGEYLAREFVLSQTQANNWMEQAHSNIKTQPGGSVFVPFQELNSVWRIFNGRLSYKKGAAILHQLRFEINDDNLFFFIMKDFQDTYAHRVASGDDFKEHVELHTDSDWDWFFDQWYYGEGYPVYNIEWWQENDTLMVRSTQKPSAEGTSFFRGTLAFEITTTEQNFQIRRMQEYSGQVFKIPLEDKVENLEFDPDNYMLKDFTLLDSAGILDAVEDRVRIYPNPSTGKIFLEYASHWHNARFHIMDSKGSKVAEGKLRNTKTEIDLSFLESGVYIARVFPERGTAKIFKMLMQ